MSIQISKPLSEAKQRLCQAALEHFVVTGYEGASLNSIAELVGIRKASIYAHFKSKDALFQQLFEDALDTECDFIQHRLIKSSETLPGQAYCDALKARYVDNNSLRFLIRTAYVPPLHLHDYITHAYPRYVDCLTAYFQQALQQRFSNLSAAQLTLYSDAYIGVVDSLHVDLLYAGVDNFETKLKAMLFLLESAMRDLKG